MIVRSIFNHLLREISFGQSKNTKNECPIQLDFLYAQKS